jgi:hypothetical protein
MTPRRCSFSLSRTDAGALSPAWLACCWVVATACAGRDDRGGGGTLDATGPDAGGLDAGHAPDDAVDEASAARCTSGVLRSPDAEEGPEMNPGRTCIDCHVQANAASGEQDAPPFAFAGTVYPTPHEPDQCVGSSSEGATVEVTDAHGTVTTVPVNAVGNFFLESESFAFPFKARVFFQGRVRAMVAPQDHGECNGCHTEAGHNKAPGRIVLP